MSNLGWVCFLTKMIGANLSEKQRIRRFFIFSKNWKCLKMFCKNLCDKVSRMKKLRWLFSCFFRAVHRGVLHFFDWHIFHGENHETKSPVLTFLKKTWKKRKVQGEMGVKNKKMLFSIASIFKGCPSWSFWTPKLFL